jgi:hypothetical protein
MTRLGRRRPRGAWCIDLRADVTLPYRLVAVRLPKAGALTTRQERAGALV